MSRIEWVASRSVSQRVAYRLSGNTISDVQRVDRGFPARYEEFLQKFRFDVEWLQWIGRNQGYDDRLLQKMQEELKQAQWWSIADFTPLENDKFGTMNKQIDGQNLPAHQCLFGFYDQAVWQIETHGEQRSAYMYLTLTNETESEKMVYMVWPSSPLSLLTRI